MKNKMIMTVLVGMLLTMFTTMAQAQTWEYNRHKDAISDADRSYVFCVLDNTFITFKVFDDGLNFFFYWDKYFLGRDGKVLVTYRIDDKPPVGPEAWSFTNNDKKSAYMPMGDVKNFAREIANARRLTIRVVDPKDGETITRVFNMRGFEAAFRQLLPSI